MMSRLFAASSLSNNLWSFIGKVLGLLFASCSPVVVNRGILTDELFSTGSPSLVGFGVAVAIDSRGESSEVGLLLGSPADRMAFPLILVLDM